MDKELVAKAHDWGLLNSLNSSLFVISGTLSIKRQDMYLLISTLGGSSANSVTMNTDYLIVPDTEVISDDPGRRSAKLQAALKYSTRIITEAEFCEMILPSAYQLFVSSLVV